MIKKRSGHCSRREKCCAFLGAGCTAAVGVYAKEENGTFWMGLMRETKNGLIAGRSPERRRIP